MIKYISLDGVVLDTRTRLLNEIDEEENKLGKSIDIVKYLAADRDWMKYLEEAPVINNAIDILKNYDPQNVKLLTRIYSIFEAVCKIDYFRRLKVLNEIILVPCGLKKTDIVTAKGNMLVDGEVAHLRDWYRHDGKSVLCDYAHYYCETSDFPQLMEVETLEEVLDPEKCEKLLRRK